MFPNFCKNKESHYETFPISWRWVGWILSGEWVLECSNGSLGLNISKSSSEFFRWFSSSLIGAPLSPKYDKFIVKDQTFSKGIFDTRWQMHTTLRWYKIREFQKSEFSAISDVSIWKWDLSKSKAYVVTWKIPRWLRIRKVIHFQVLNDSNFEPSQNFSTENGSHLGILPCHCNVCKVWDQVGQSNVRSPIYFDFNFFVYLNFHWKFVILNKFADIDHTINQIK